MLPYNEAFASTWDGRGEERRLGQKNFRSSPSEYTAKPHNSSASFRIRTIDVFRFFRGLRYPLDTGVTQVQRSRKVDLWFRD